MPPWPRWYTAHRSAPPPDCRPGAGVDAAVRLHHDLRHAPAGEATGVAAAVGKEVDQIVKELDAAVAPPLKVGAPELEKLRIKGREALRAQRKAGRAAVQFSQAGDELHIADVVFTQPAPHLLRMPGQGIRQHTEDIIRNALFLEQRPCR